MIKRFLVILLLTAIFTVNGNSAASGSEQSKIFVQLYLNFTDICNSNVVTQLTKKLSALDGKFKRIIANLKELNFSMNDLLEFRAVYVLNNVKGYKLDSFSKENSYLYFSIKTAKKITVKDLIVILREGLGYSEEHAGVIEKNEKKHIRIKEGGEKIYLHIIPDKNLIVGSFGAPAVKTGNCNKVLNQLNSIKTNKYCFVFNIELPEGFMGSIIGDGEPKLIHGAKVDPEVLKDVKSISLKAQVNDDISVDVVTAFLNSTNADKYMITAKKLVPVICSDITAQYRDELGIVLDIKHNVSMLDKNEVLIKYIVLPNNKHM